MDIIRQSTLWVVNPIMIYSYGFLLNCTMGIRLIRLNGGPDVSIQADNTTTQSNVSLRQ